MATVRRDVWTLGTDAQPWHPTLLAYANAVRAMQARPIGNPTSWRYQAAIHGLAGTTPPPGAPWNECQHGSWYFLPWHRMYLFQFERIVRAAVVAQGGSAEWALPYWNPEAGGNANRLPPAFRAARLPDGTTNPLFVARRRAQVNGGSPISSLFTSSAAARGTNFFTTPASGAPDGFGGPRTGLSHQGGNHGALESQPHDVMHVRIGGPGGLMTDPDTAALDPIFWLHHCNIDRIWEEWRVSDVGSSPTATAWAGRTFRLRNEAGATVTMRVADVVNALTGLDYTYDSMPAVASAGGGGAALAPRTRRRMVGRTAATLALSSSGLAASVPLGPLPPARAAASGRAPAYYLELADIEGTVNPGVVYGVFVNPPPGATGEELERHRVGLVPFFGIEHTTAAGRSSVPQPLRYQFDITALVSEARAGHEDVGELRVELRPEPETLDDPAEAAATAEPIRIGTIAVYAG